jgi:hypothetical protein
LYNLRRERAVMTATKLKRYGLKRSKKNNNRRKQRRCRDEEKMFWIKSNVGYFKHDRDLKKYRQGVA